MWARIFEISIACWLIMSPFIFRYEAGRAWLWFNDYISGGLILVFAMLAFMIKLRKIHLLNAVVGLWLILLAFLQEPAPPGGPFDGPFQNYLAVGLLLIMFGIIPTRASLPPTPWREFYEEHAERIRQEEAEDAAAKGEA